MILLVIIPVAYAGSWSGYVLDTGGAGLQDVNVSAYDANTDNYIDSTTTDATGFFNVTNGNVSVYLESSKNGYTTDITQALPPVTDDRILPFNITLSLANPPGSIAGTVSNSTNPILNAAVRALQGGSEIANTTTDASGAYTLSGLNHGTYTVEASATGYVTQDITNVVVEPGSTTGNIDFVLNMPPSCTDADGDSYAIEGGSCGLIDFDDNDASKYPGAACSRNCYSGSTYDETGACTGGTYTCSNGGSSVYDGTSYTIDLTKSGLTLRLRKKDIVKFDFRNKQHQVEILKIASSSVSLLVKSDPIAVYLEEGQAGKYDLNDDDIYDLKINVDDISFYRTTLSFYLIDEPLKIQTNATNTTITQTYIPPPLPKPKKQVIIEDVVPDQQDNETTKKSGIVTASFKFIKSIPYISYVAAGIIILMIIIVAIKLFKAEEVKEEDFSQYNKEELRKRIARLEKQIARLKKTV